MNERNIPEFNQESIERLLFDNYYSRGGNLHISSIMEIVSAAKMIVDYAERCGIIKPQSPMK
jgi:hypothetical protein